MKRRIRLIAPFAILLVAAAVLAQFGGVSTSGSSDPAPRTKAKASGKSSCSSASALKNARVWEHSYCGGNYVLLTRTSPNVSNLGSWNLDNKISSVQCGYECGKVRLHSDTGYGGIFYEVPNKSNKATLGTWNDRASSVKSFWL